MHSNDDLKDVIQKTMMTKSSDGLHTISCNFIKSSNIFGQIIKPGKWILKVRILTSPN